MKKILLSLVVLVVVVLLAVAGYAAHLVSRLNSPEFQEEVRAELSRQMGADVRVEEMDIAILSGLTLRGVAVANPPPFDGALFTAQAFVLRYQLRPLLSGRVEVEELTLETPTLGLIVDEDGRYNYEALGGGTRAAGQEQVADGAIPAPPDAPPSDAAPGETATSAPLDIVLSRIRVSDASVTIVDEEGTSLMALEDTHFRAAVQVSGGVTQGRARASIGALNMADMLFVREIEAPLTMSTEQVQLSPIEGQVAGGTATGEVTAHLKDGFRYEGTLDLEGVSVKTLLQEAQSSLRVAGTLQGTLGFEGTGPMSTLKARGQAQVVDCRIEDSKMLALVAMLLKVPELASPEFQDCRIEYSLANNQLSTPVLSLKGQAMEVTGKGKVNLLRSTIDYDLNLALAEALLAKIPVQELRAAFKPRDDGLSVVAFRAYGPMEAPQTDLMSRVGKAAATEAAKDQANKLLKKIF